MDMEEKDPMEKSEEYEKDFSEWTDEETPEKKSFLKENLGTLIMSALTLLLAILLFSGYLKPVMVHQTSMYPTLRENDYLFIIRTRDYQPGDIIVFDHEETGEEHLIKRVIATEGDTVLVEDGAVYVNGERLREDYLPEGLETEGDVAVTLLEDELFVMGDNRPVSLDSRYFGTVDEEDVLGEAKLRIFHKPTLF